MQAAAPGGRLPGAAAACWLPACCAVLWHATTDALLLRAAACTVPWAVNLSCLIPAHCFSAVGGDCNQYTEGQTHRHTEVAVDHLQNRACLCVCVFARVSSSVSRSPTACAD